MRILMVIDSLEGGGAEHVFTTLACEFASSHQVEVLVFKRAGVHLARLSAASIAVHEVPIQRSKLKFFRQVRRQIVSLHPDVVLSFMDTPNLVAAIALTNTRIPLVISVRVDHRSYVRGCHLRLKRRLSYFAFRRAHRVISVSETLARYLREDFPITRNKVVTIHNGLDLERLSQAAELRLVEGDAALFSSPVIVAVGRLDYQKDYPTLLRAFARLDASFQATKLLILGVGAEEATLRALAVQLGVSARVHFLGFRPIPAPFVRAATLYVMSSIFEGYPNALAEAMFVNGCCISTDCPTGPSEIIESGVDGLLVPVGDSDALANAMHELLGNPKLRQQFRRRAIESASQRTVARMKAQYLQVLEKAALEGKCVS